MVVASLNVVLIFGEEVEGDFGPGSVFPLSPNDEGDHSLTVGSDGFDGEKLVGGVLALEVIDRYGNAWSALKHPL